MRVLLLRARLASLCGRRAGQRRRVRGFWDPYLPTSALGAVPTTLSFKSTIANAWDHLVGVHTDFEVTWDAECRLRVAN